MESWEESQIWEKAWHGDCVNSWQEESKQIVYAQKMGLSVYGELGKYPVYDLKQQNIVDIGAGPYSLLLKGQNLGKCFAVDPNLYPEWVMMRYKIKNIEYVQKMGEDLTAEMFPPVDEVWIYNCLQHTENPEKIIQNARKIGKIIRIFEWINTFIMQGHPHSFTENQLNGWLWGTGKVEDLNEYGCIGTCYYGIFKGLNYGFLDKK
jgi:hypothetical protein